MEDLNKKTVLVLNKNWQAIHVKSPAEALSMMYVGSATALNVLGKDQMIPCKWEEWINLPHDDDSDYVSTINNKVKIPKIIVLCSYNKIPVKRPRFSASAIWKRDGGICQYSGKRLTKNDGNIDHVIPRSRGGKSDWKNCVLCHKNINSKKANMTPEEAGIKLIKQPDIPKNLPVTFFIKNRHNVKEWDIFLKSN
jgi:5-methylcytosine-specific restriction endonuclease McrA